MNAQDTTTLLIEKLTQLDTRISDLESKQAQMTESIAYTRGVLWDARMLVNELNKNRESVPIQTAQTEPVRQQTHHYTSEESVTPNPEPISTEIPIREPIPVPQSEIPVSVTTQTEGAQDSSTVYVQPIAPAQNTYSEATTTPSYTEPTPISKPIKSIDWEKFLGRNAMGILASVLIFLSLGIFGAVVFPLLGDAIKFTLMIIFSGVLSFAGIMKTEKHQNAFSLSLLSCGIGAMYITFLCGRLIFGMYGDIPLFFLFFLWAAGNYALYRRYESVVFSIVGHLGILISVSLALKNIADTYIPDYVSDLTRSGVNGAIKSLVAVTGFLLLTEAVYAIHIQKIPALCLKTASTGISSMLIAIMIRTLSEAEYLEDAQEAGAFLLTNRGWKPLYLLAGFIAIILIGNAVLDLLWSKKRNILLTQLCGVADTAFMVLISFIMPEPLKPAFFTAAEAVMVIVFASLYTKTEYSKTSPEQDILHKLYLIAIMVAPGLFAPVDAFLPFKYTGVFWFALPVIIIAYRKDIIRRSDILIMDITVAASNVIPLNILRGSWHESRQSSKDSYSLLILIALTWILCVIYAIVRIRYEKKHAERPIITHIVALSTAVCLCSAASTITGAYPIVIRMHQDVYVTLFMLALAVITAAMRHVIKTDDKTYKRFSGISNMACSVIGVLCILSFDTEPSWIMKHREYAEAENYFICPEWINGKAMPYVLLMLLIIAVTTLFLSATLYLYRNAQMKRKTFGLTVGIAYTVLWWSIAVKADIPYFLSAGLIIWAVSCIALGFRLKIRSMRLYGLVLSILSVIKLVMLDIYYDNSIARAASMAVCGILLFVISFVYNRVEKVQTGTDV